MHHWQSKGKSSTADDLVLLPKISHDSISDNLKQRFLEDSIYTYIGNVLIAINPFKNIDIYTNKHVDMYQGAATYENPPHIYAIADNMFRNMMIDFESQCVIISGESGAGKTVSAKKIMEYISKVSGGKGRVEDVKEIILKSNPLLEAFGNAKTVRNNNSSRFGKYIEIQFDRGGEPLGGKISQFLLEKSRVVLQNSNERNFHIFYQILSGCDSQLKGELGITTPDYFSYLNQTGVYTVDDTDDKEDFKLTTDAMSVMGMTPEVIRQILSVSMAVLHIGNMVFNDGAQKAEFVDERSVEFPAYLLGIDSAMLSYKMTSREMADPTNKSENIIVTFNREEANHARDALAKTLYSRLFDYIVERVNKAMAIDITNMNIGILDIYGFEIFTKNGFEQFCINYVNEKLQQIFIELTLKAEQEEYKQEGIQWSPVDYFNNKVVCDLIELKNPPGIFSILDDVCATAFKVTKDIDCTFVQKMDGARLTPDHYNSYNKGFIIFHYAGRVQYDCQGFCERNRDQLNVDLIEMMQSSSEPFVAGLFPDKVDRNKRTTVTVGNRIRKQANNLVEQLMKCQPHYIRCIKPNETKRARDWENDRVVDQVTYLGLRENIIVRRAGYAYRRPFAKFLQRYAILTKQTWPTWKGDPKEGIKHLMKAADISDGQWQIGKTKLFIKDPESLFLLEERRERKFNYYAKIIQLFFRKLTANKHYLRLRQNAADLFLNKKERRQHSLNRNFIGDYLYTDENPHLRSLVAKKEKVQFSSFVTTFNSKFKKIGRDLILTNKFVYLIGREKVKQGEKKGQFVETIISKLDIQQFKVVKFSPYQDNIVVLCVDGELDNVLEIEFKTEFIMLLSKSYQELMNRHISIQFTNNIDFSVKKTMTGGNVRKMTFNLLTTPPTNNQQVTYKVSGLLKASMAVDVTHGLPNNTPPGLRDVSAIKILLPEIQRRGIKIKSTTNQRQSNYQGGGTQQRAQPQHHQQQQQQPRNQVQHQQNQLKSRAPFNPANLPPPPPGPTNMSPLKGIAPTNKHVNDEDIIRSIERVSSYSQQHRTSVASTAVPPKPPRPSRPVKPKKQVRALYDYQASDVDELSFKIGDLIELIREDNEGWWTGKLRGKEGLMPSNYVEKI